MILRGSSDDCYSIIHESKSHQHSFNFPYQIGTHGDDPSCAVFEKLKVQKGDIVVMGTDGLFDNVFP